VVEANVVKLSSPVIVLPEPVDASHLIQCMVVL
jgi:hypothetical protein